MIFLVSGIFYLIGIVLTIFSTTNNIILLYDSFNSFLIS